MKKSYKVKLLIVLFAIVLIFTGHSVKAQQSQSQTVDYKSAPTVDSDSDGLTDEGEKQIYHTEKNKFDTDGDGFSDGVEVTAGTDPLIKASFPGMIIPLEQTKSPNYETPWAWYVSRSSALVAFFLLYVSIFLGLTLRIPFLRKIFSPVYSMKVHGWIALQATLFALIHGMVLMFDKFYNFSFADLFVPFVSSFEPKPLAMGIVAFYLMVLLVLTSYARKFISQKIWRITHFANIALYVLGMIHAVNLGTDMKNPIVFDIFIFANAFLIFVMLYNIEIRISDARRIKKARALQDNSNNQLLSS